MILSSLSHAQRIWCQSAFLLLAFIPIILLAHVAETRQLYDIGIWIKPLKFHLSTALHLLTFAVLVEFLPRKVNHAYWLTGLALVSATATIVEVFLIDMQAMRGVRSHFNYDTQFDGLIYALMGIGALLLSLPALILGLVFWCVPISDKLTPGFKLSITLGLLFGFVLTVGIGGYMSTLPTGHWVGAPPTDSAGLPIVGWTQQGGDLRVAHFFATHLMQFLPLIGFLLDKKIRLHVMKAKTFVYVFALAGVGITLGTLIQALEGKPFIAL
jgi:hypothetical protein